MNQNNPDLKQQIIYDKREDNLYKFKLKEDVVVVTDIYGYTFASDYLQLTPEGRLTLTRKYAWNGVTGANDTAESMLASALHDGIYQLIKLNVLPQKYRKHADRLMRLAAIAQDMTTIKAWIAWIIVRIAGWWFTRKSASNSS